MGRLVVFIARLMTDYWTPNQVKGSVIGVDWAKNLRVFSGIGTDERTALVIDEVNFRKIH
jgi:hypothetical protein